MNKTFKMNYLNRDFSSIKESLKNYAKRYYSNELYDLSEASINSLMLESVAYVGDVLSYYLDYQTNETFLSTAIENKNILNLAKSMGYKQRDANSTVGNVSIYMLIPDDGSGNPDYSRAPTIKKGAILSSTNNKRYTTTEDIIINGETIGTNHVVARTNDLGNPIFHAIKLFCPIISGFINTEEIEIQSFKKFNKVLLNSPNITEVISVVDSEGNEYYEVPNLAQNIVYKSFYNSDGNPKFILKPITAQRRFIFDYELSLPYILFGSKQYNPDEDLSINPIAEPTKFALNRYNNDYLQDEFFEPNKLLNGDSYGIGPENTVITVTYRENSTGNNTAEIGTINKIEDAQYVFSNSTISNTIKDTIISSIQVSNEERISGQGTAMSVNEIRDLAGNIYNAQNRAVTAKDYETLSYMMPQKYGSIKRVAAYRDPTSLKNNINLYVVCNDQSGYLIKGNEKIKQNLKTWLSNYKIITDTVDIIDAKVINLAINFTILLDPNCDKPRVLDEVTKKLYELYLTKPQIGESFSVIDVYRQIRKNSNVLDIKDVKIKNVTNYGYSQTYFSVEENTTPDGNMIKIPKNAIYEVRYLLSDIIGNWI